MGSTYNNLLLEVLSIIGYSNKYQFVAKFEEQNHTEAMNNCMENLSQDIQDELIAMQANPEVIKECIPTEMYSKEILEVSTKAFAEFLEHMTPVLTSEQQEKIAHLFAKL